MAKEKTTEDKIVSAAKKVFIAKGMDGARMHDIADEAGINKALLHYYFRTKQKLFEEVFAIVSKEIFSVLGQAVSEKCGFEEFIENLIEQYIYLLRSKPYISQFVIHEIYRKPERVVELLKNSQFDKQLLLKRIQDAVDEKVIKPIDPVQFITNILSMCIFPFIAKPLITGFILDGDTEKFESYLDERPAEVVKFVKQAIFLNPKNIS